jgi:hypothetical protein
MARNSYDFLGTDEKIPTGYNALSEAPAGRNVGRLFNNYRIQYEMTSASTENMTKSMKNR